MLKFLHETTHLRQNPSFSDFSPNAQYLYGAEIFGVFQRGWAKIFCQRPFIWGAFFGKALGALDSRRFFSLASALFFLQALKSGRSPPMFNVFSLISALYCSFALFLLRSKSVAAYCRPLPNTEADEKIRIKPILLSSGIALALLWVSFFLTERQVNNRPLTFEENSLLSVNARCVAFYVMKSAHYLNRKKRMGELKAEENQKLAQENEKWADAHMPVLYLLLKNDAKIKERSEAAFAELMNLVDATAGTDALADLFRSRETECTRTLLGRNADFASKLRGEKIYEKSWAQVLPF